MKGKKKEKKKFLIFKWRTANAPHRRRLSASPLSPLRFSLSARLFAANVNEHGNNQAICLHVANFITVNDL